MQGLAGGGLTLPLCSFAPPPFSSAEGFPFPLKVRLPEQVGAQPHRGEEQRGPSPCPHQDQPQQPAETPDPVDQTVSDIDDSVQRLVAKAMAEAKEENERSRQGQDKDLSDTAEFPAQKDQKPPVNEDMDQTTRIDFGELQFGRDYEIK